MSLVIRSPLDLFFNRMKMIDSMDFDDFGLFPSYDNSYLYPTEDGYTMEVPIPGMTKNDVKIQLDENTLYIKAQVDKKQKHRQVASNYQYVQSLPKDVDVESFQASVENGVLTIQMKKFQKTRNVREISIQ